MDPKLEAKLTRLPQAPGVYLMRDRAGRIVYVGKAVNLRSRVRSYFISGGDGRAFVPLLGQLLGDIETVVVSSDKEAVLLENELIKRHKPRFNVQLRDDKNFLCLRLDAKRPWPRLDVVRRFENDGARYFGPYASAASLRETLRIVNRHFQLRTCSDHALKTRKRPCLLHQIGRCPAPCVLDVDEAVYRRNVEEALLFLEGRGGELVADLRQRMQAASDGLRFEEAAQLRDQLRAVERSLEHQKVATDEAIDRDVVGLVREADRLSLYVLFVRGGRMAGGQAHVSSGHEFPDEELLRSFLGLYYGDGAFVPQEVLLPLELEEGAAAIEELLTERRGTKVYVGAPRRGRKKELVELANQNAEVALQEKGRAQEELHAILERLQKRLGLRRPPRRIECFDISHFQGSAIVASQVAALDGEPDKSRYRRYHVKSTDGQDDFASMREVLLRRAKRGLKGEEFPDLFVVDGGKGQLMAAHAALKDVGVEGVELVGLAKSREKDSGGRSPERIFVLGRKDPIVLPQNAPELFVLTRLRDEAHRFAITFQKRVLRRERLASPLDEVSGIGESRKKALLRHFGSLTRLQRASVDAMCEVEGMGRATAERVHRHLHPEDGVYDRTQEGPLDPVRASSLEDAEDAEGASRSD